MMDKKSWMSIKAFIGNKAGNRPHYYCFEDMTTGSYWMIADNHLMLTSEHVAGIIEQKAREVVVMLKFGVK